MDDSRLSLAAEGAEERHGLRRCALAFAALAVVWLVVLPWLARRQPIADHIRLQQRMGINPSAKFYTELEIMPPIIDRLEHLEPQERQALWRVSPAPRR